MLFKKNSTYIQIRNFFMEEIHYSKWTKRKRDPKAPLYKRFATVSFEGYLPAACCA